MMTHLNVSRLPLFSTLYLPTTTCGHTLVQNHQAWLFRITGYCVAFHNAKLRYFERDKNSVDQVIQSSIYEPAVQDTGSPRTDKA